MTTTTATPDQLWTRPREVCLRVINADAGVCTSCDKPLVYARFCWDHRITDPMYRPGPWKLGEDSFDKYVHADGSELHPDSLGGWFPCYPKATYTCPQCKTPGVLKTTQEAWGDRTVCTAGCGYTNWYSIGD